MSLRPKAKPDSGKKIGKYRPDDRRRSFRLVYGLNKPYLALIQTMYPTDQ